LLNKLLAAVLDVVHLTMPVIASSAPEGYERLEYAHILPLVTMADRSSLHAMLAERTLTDDMQDELLDGDKELRSTPTTPVEDKYNVGFLRL
jgi:hypothetical protein